jgi:hypothetical protein
MRSTFSVSTLIWALAGCLTFSLGCRQGEGDRCETTADCSGDLECRDTGTHNGVCRRPTDIGAAGSSGQSTGVPTSTGTSTDTSTGTGTSTDTSTGPADASVAPLGGDDAAADASLTD